MFYIPIHSLSFTIVSAIAINIPLTQIILSMGNAPYEKTHVTWLFSRKIHRKANLTLSHRNK